MQESYFDYERVQEVYENINKILGDVNSPDSIVGILNDTKKIVDENVNVVDKAVYGDLAKKLNEDWNNVSSNFNEFIEYFNNWSKSIATTMSNYSNFEETNK